MGGASSGFRQTVYSLSLNVRTYPHGRKFTHQLAGQPGLPGPRKSVHNNQDRGAFDQLRTGQINVAM